MNNGLGEFEQAFISMFTAHLQANPNKRHTLHDIEQMKSVLRSLHRSGMIDYSAFKYLTEFLNAFPTWDDMPPVDYSPFDRDVPF